MSYSVAKRENNISALSFADMKQASEMIAESNLFPSWNTPAKVLTLMLLAKAEGSDPLSAINRYDNIQGKISKRPQAMLDDFIQAGGKIEWLESTNEAAELKLVTPNNTTHIEKFTIEDAKTAGLASKDNWKKYPKSMLRARCISFAMRAVFPSATNLLYTPEETGDFQQNEQVKSVQVEKTKEKILKNVTPVEDDFSTLTANLDQIKLLKYLKSIDWITNDLNDLTENNKSKIINNFDKFSAQVEKMEVE